MKIGFIFLFFVLCIFLLTPLSSIDCYSKESFLKKYEKTLRPKNIFPSEREFLGAERERVFKDFWVNKNHFYIKFIYTNNEDRIENSIEEYKSLLRFKDLKSVVSTYGCINDDIFFAIIFEYLGSKDLWHLINDFAKLSVRSKNKYFLEQARDLEKIHKAGYIHGDIKTENYILFNKSLVLIDFEHMTPLNIMMSGGTYSFSPPELRLKSIPSTDKVDVFSYGLVIIDMYIPNKYLVFENDIKIDKREHYSRIYLSDILEYLCSYIDKIDKDVANLVRGMVRMEPSERYSMSKAIQKMEEINYKYKKNKIKSNPSYILISTSKLI